MSDLMTTTPMPEIDLDIAAIRGSLIGNRITIAQAATALGVSERAIYLALEKRPIPYVRCFNVRYMELEDLRRALVTDQNTAARGRGRPRKAA
jgi:hypothetical protein